MTIVQGVHLVGSVPLGDEREVFSAVGTALGSHLRRLPDGETGERQQWVQFQLQVLGQRDEFELVPSPVPGPPLPVLKLRDGVDAESVDFGDLGYAASASRSYAAFEEAVAAGLVPPDVRFQVSMPTPLANATAWLQFNAGFPELNRRYEAAMMADLARITAAIPHERLAIQWDVCFELLMYEGWMPMPAGVDRSWIADHLVRISDAVPQGVELGYHFCFGDFNHEHVQQPGDLGELVKLAMDVLPRVGRQIDWIHLPVPIDRDDDAYFEPLRDLQLPEGTEVYVGLVHFRDGVEGARRRAATAGRFLAQFGVATECGMGRRPEGRGAGDGELEQLLLIHREVADPVRDV